MNGFGDLINDCKFLIFQVNRDEATARRRKEYEINYRKIWEMYDGYIDSPDKLRCFLYERKKIRDLITHINRDIENEYTDNILTSGLYDYIPPYWCPHINAVIKYDYENEEMLLEDGKYFNLDYLHMRNTKTRHYWYDGDDLLNIFIGEGYEKIDIEGLNEERERMWEEDDEEGEFEGYDEDDYMELIGITEDLTDDEIAFLEDYTCEQSCEFMTFSKQLNAFYEWDICDCEYYIEKYTEEKNWYDFEDEEKLYIIYLSLRPMTASIKKKGVNPFLTLDSRTFEDRFGDALIINRDSVPITISYHILEKIEKEYDCVPFDINTWDKVYK